MFTTFAQAASADPVGGITSYLFTQGVLGMVVVALGIVVIKLYNKNEQLQKDKDALQKEKEAIIESRRMDAVETRNEVTSILPGISQSLLHISDKIEVVTNNRRKQ
jgi:hypothetical protein